MSELTAVSYTHLDVYKRQAQYVSFLLGEWDAGDPGGVANERGGECQHGSS